MLQLLFLLIVFLIFFLLLLLVVPYHYNFSFKYQQNLSYKISLLIVFLRLSFSSQGNEQILFLEISGYKKSFQLNESRVGKYVENKYKKIVRQKIDQLNSSKVKEKDKKNKSALNFDFEMLNRENLNHIFKFMVKMLKILKMDYLKLYLVFSFADPYYNGLFLAYYYTFKEFFDYPDFKAEINWQEENFEAEGSAGGEIIPALIIFHLLKFIFSLKSIKIFWRLSQSNSKKG